jgi:two-component system chemotaxis response regulator CheB
LQTRDIIVIGASMGGVDALSRLAGQLPADLPASVLVVQHVSEDSPGLLAGILGARGALPASQAVDGMPLERGRIYVAPPGRHLLLGEEGIRVTFGPRENLSRPAIDTLFRTAAVNYRSRVIGVVLTGLLADGAAGLLAVERCGGAAVVQSPDDAEYPEMPRNALAATRAPRQTTLAGLGPLLVRLAAQPAPEPPPVPEMLRIEARITERAMSLPEPVPVLGTPTGFTCPECQGSIQAIDDGGLVRFRCRVGHAYSAQDWLAEKATAVEDSLWVALQTLEERADMLVSMARAELERGRERSGGSLGERARETRLHADRLRELLRHLPE